jgi:hypothetical protein
MLLKIGKTTPRCPRWLPGDEHTGQSWLSCGEYTEVSQLLCDEYTVELTSWCIWNKHQNRFTGNFLATKRPRSKDSLSSVLIAGESRLSDYYCTSSFFLWTNFLGHLPGVFITGESQLPGDEHTGSHEPTEVNKLGNCDSPVWIHWRVYYEYE